MDSDYIVKIVEREDPVITAADQVLIAVKYAGICGSDLHTAKGERPAEIYPRVPGHEIVGTVRGVGGGVTRVGVGERVAVEPIETCGRCYACRRGRKNVCATLKTRGVHLDGGMQELYLTTQDKVYPLPENLSFRQAALAEPYTIGLQICTRARVGAGDRVLIHGAGPIGVMVMDVAKQLGAFCAVSEIKEERLRLARELGADLAVNPAREDPYEALRAAGGRGPSVIVDTVGRTGIIEESIRNLDEGGTLLNACFSTEAVRFEMEPFVERGLTVAGSRLQSGKFGKVTGACSDRLKALEAIITHEFPLDEGAAAFALFLEGRGDTGKILIRMEEINPNTHEKAQW